MVVVLVRWRFWCRCFVVGGFVVVVVLVRWRFCCGGGFGEVEVLLWWWFW